MSSHTKVHYLQPAWTSAGNQLSNEMQNISFATTPKDAPCTLQTQCVASTAGHYRRQDCRTRLTAGLH
jgi:hypothetical protein